MKKIRDEINENWIEDWNNFFGKIEDPRIDRKKMYPLNEVIILGLCVIISGAEGWVDVERYGIEKYDWLSKFLKLENGVPSHDTIGRVFSIINPTHFND